MTYTALIADSTHYETGVMRRVVVDTDDLNQVYGLAQVAVAIEIFESRHGVGAEPMDHADEWTRIYDHIPVLAIVEGAPKVWINDAAVEPASDNCESS